MHEKILLVDDDVSILLLVSDVLEEKGLEVTAVRSGEEALRRVEEGRFDLILLDIKAADPALCRELTGRDNRNAFALLDYCEAIGKPVWIRHVLVPGVTLVRDRLEMLAERIGGRRCVEKVELLPFHKLGQYKYRELGISFPLAETPEPAAEELEMAREPFLLRNLPL